MEQHATQIKHHQFLTQKDTVASLDSLIHDIRNIVEISRSTRLPPLNSQGWSEAEEAKWIGWTRCIEKALYDFRPSDSMIGDPLLIVMEKLQILMNGPPYFSDFAIRARNVLQKWERDGIFESTDSSDTDEDDDTERVQAKTYYQKELRVRRDRALDDDVENEDDSLDRHLFRVYSSRKITAMWIIKRNVLKWMRTRKTSEEIKAFGNTMQTFIQHYNTFTRSADVREVRIGEDLLECGITLSKAHGEHESVFIMMHELMHFSRHVALYSIDQALRQVEILDKKYLLQRLRSAYKIQMAWKKARQNLRVEQHKRQSVHRYKRAQRNENQLMREREVLKLTRPDTRQLSSKQSPAKHSRRMLASQFIRERPGTAVLDEAKEVVTHEQASTLSKRMRKAKLIQKSLNAIRTATSVDKTAIESEIQEHESPRQPQDGVSVAAYKEKSDCINSSDDYLGYRQQETNEVKDVVTTVSDTDTNIASYTSPSPMSTGIEFRPSEILQNPSGSKLSTTNSIKNGSALQSKSRFYITNGNANLVLVPPVSSRSFSQWKRSSEADRVSRVILASKMQQVLPFASFGSVSEPQPLLSNLSKTTTLKRLPRPGVLKTATAMVRKQPKLSFLVNTRHETHQTSSIKNLDHIDRLMAISETFHNDRSVKWTAQRLMNTSTTDSPMRPLRMSPMNVHRLSNIDTTNANLTAGKE